jgi:hypothetical protein
VIFSIVAVTGLAGHAFGSWRNRSTRTMWLKDFLPRDVNKVRIMTYGYDSLIHSGNIDYRRNFIEQLTNSRSEAKVTFYRDPFEALKPIIFCAAGSAAHFPRAQFGGHIDTSSKQLHSPNMMTSAVNSASNY